MANDATVGILRALLTADTAQFDAAMKRAGATAGGFSKDLNKVGQQATTLGTQLTKTLTVPLVGLAGASAKAFIDFESSFAGVGKTVDGVSDNFGNLTSFGKEMALQFRGLAKQIPINVNDLNRLGEAAGALGIPKGEVVKFVEVMAKLGVTTNLTADQAADAIARIQNIFGAAGKDTDRLASTLVALGNAGASTESEIVEMAQRIAGAGHTIGLTQAEVLAFASSLASVGINAEAGGSAISRIFLKMNDAVMGGGDSLEEFARVAGRSVGDFKKLFQTDAAQATQLFIAGLGELKKQGENTNKTMEGLVGKNIILKDTLNRLSGAGKLLSDQLELGNKAWQDNTALTIEAQKRFATTESQLKLLWAQVRDVGITLGAALKPAIDAVISGIQVLIPVIDSAAKLFGGLPGPIQLAVLGVGALVAAVGPMIYIFGQLALASGAVVGAFGAQGLATRALAAQNGLLATSLVLVGKAVAAASVAFAAWELGKWIGETTRATDGVEYLTGKLMGLSDAEIQAGYNARRQAEALKAAKGDTLDAAEINKQLAEATTKADDAAKALTAGLPKQAAAHKATKEEIKQQKEEQKEAKKAAEELEKQVESERDALKSLGVVTQRDVVTQIDAFARMERTATAEGVSMVAFLTAVKPKLEDLRVKAKAAGLDLSELDEQLGYVNDELARLHGAPPVLDPAKVKSSAEALQATIGSIGLVTSSTLAAGQQAFITQRAFETFGFKTKAELADVARAARIAYDDLVASGKATPEQLQQAWDDVLEAEKRARGKSIAAWKVYWGQYLGMAKSALDTVAKGLAASLLGMSGSLHQEHQQQAEDAQEAFEETQERTREDLEDTQKAARDEYEDTANHARETFEQTKKDALDKYKEMEANGEHTAEELAIAWERTQQEIQEAQKRADEEIELAHQKMLDEIKASEDKNNGELENAHQAMLDAKERASHRWRDNLKDIWKGLKADFGSILTEMLADFEKRFLRGLINLIPGVQGDFVSAFAGMFGAGTKAGIATLGTEISLGAPAISGASGTAGTAAGVSWGAAFSAAASVAAYAALFAIAAYAADKWWPTIMEHTFGPIARFIGDAIFGGGDHGTGDQTQDPGSAYNPNDPNNPYGDYDPGNPVQNGDEGARDGNNGVNMATGGIVMPRPGGTRAVLAEAGYPEAVIPLTGGAGMGFTRTQTVILEVDRRTLAQILVEPVVAETVRLRLT